MVKYIFWGIILYFFIRFVFGFLLPVFRATRQMRNQVKDFQSKMEEQQRQQNFQQNGAAQEQSAKPKANKEDYIDFEEIK